METMQTICGFTIPMHTNNLTVMYLQNYAAKHFIYIIS